MTTPAQSIAFPEVALIKKGTPKQVIVKDGRKVEIMGKDLDQKFRIHFRPGTDEVRAAWDKKHAGDLVHYDPAKFTIPEGYEVTKIRAIVPATSVWNAWDYANECYNAGRRVAQADDKHYLNLRDPLTGQYIVKNGEPFKEFTVGDTVTYERNGKVYNLKVKSSGRLRLVLEDLVVEGQLVQVTLKTTSFYDCQNIRQQLAGIQAIADIVNNGNAGGIPFDIYRAQQEVCWNKPDGGAQRVEKWFINLKPDPEWVKRAFARMGANALTGEAIAAALLPANLVSGVNPDGETFDDEDIIPGEALPDAGDQGDTGFLVMTYEEAIKYTWEVKPGETRTLNNLGTSHLQEIVEKSGDEKLVEAAYLVMEHDFGWVRPGNDAE